jgi:hypothetical protein
MQNEELLQTIPQDVQRFERCEEEVSAPIRARVSQGGRDVGIDRLWKSNIVAVHPGGAVDLGNVETQLVHHDLEASNSEAGVNQRLIAEKHFRPAFIEEKVGKRLWKDMTLPSLT